MPEFPQTIADPAVTISLTTRQEGTDNCVKKCQTVQVRSTSAQVSPTQLSIIPAVTGLLLFTRNAVAKR